MYLPKYTITETLLARIGDAEVLRTRIQAAPIQLTWLENIRMDSLIRQAHFSTAIEGNPMTLPEVEALAASKNVNVADQAKQEVLNYLAALRRVAKMSMQAPVTENAVLKLHKIIMKELLEPKMAGVYKRTRNVIMSAGKITYRPPGPSAAKPGMRALISWLEGPGQTTHPIVASACAHYEVARLHPFRDGNGRLARVLATWVLYRRGFDSQHLLAVDQYFKEDHEGYYQALQRVRQEKEDLTSWLEYVALAIVNTLQRTYERIEQLALPPTAKGLSVTRQQERLLLELRTKRAMTIEQLERLLGVKRVQVYRVLQPLVKKEILEKSSTRPVMYRLASH